MKITNEQIESEMIEYFNPFAFMAVKYGDGITEGGFDVQKINDDKIKFIIFDKKWEDDDKKEIWSNEFDISQYNSLLEVKIAAAKIIEPSIMKFCGK
jgi:hypothetical protein